MAKKKNINEINVTIDGEVWEKALDTTFQKKNKEACANFAKAKELGDTVVDQLIEKYCQ